MSNVDDLKSLVAEARAEAAVDERTDCHPIRFLWLSFKRDHAWGKWQYGMGFKEKARACERCGHLEHRKLTV